MDLSTTYLGFKLSNPFIVGASPMADNPDNVRRLEDAGAAAVVVRSLFEEQITAEVLATHLSIVKPAESFGEATSYFPDPEDFILGPDAYLAQVQKLKAAVRIPVIASLNGVTPGGWLEYARLIEQAGADALELNLFAIEMDPEEDSAAVERRQIEMVGRLKASIGLPIAVKLSPFYTSLTGFAKQLLDAGADALVLFNRFFEPDIDVEELEVVSKLHLSSPPELLLRLRWLAILSGKLDAPLAVTGGVHAAVDSAKAIMAGAGAVQLVSSLLKHGPSHLGQIIANLQAWLAEHEYDSLAQMHGSMNLARCPDPAAYERGNYSRMLQTWQPL